MGRKSQTDKFNARLSKRKLDEVAINTRDYQKRQEDVKKYGAEGVDELMAQGSIREAAVVFSHEGMKAFANMFSNSVESSVVNVLSSQMDTITKSIESKVESIIEAKMLEMLEGMTEGMKKMAQPQVTADLTEEQAEAAMKVVKQMFPNAETLEPLNMTPGKIEDNPQAKFEQRVKEFRENKKVEADPAPAPTLSPEVAERLSTATTKNEPKKTGSLITAEGIDLPRMNNSESFRYSSGKAAAEEIKDYVLAIFKKYQGMEVKSSDVTTILREVFNIRMINPTLTYRHVMSYDHNLENVGMGVYKYEEKNFKPTI